MNESNNTAETPPLLSTPWIQAAAALALFFGALLLMGGTKAPAVPTDEGLLFHALARHFSDHGFIGTPAERLPAGENALWIAILAALSAAGVPWDRLATLAAALCAAVGIAAIPAFGRRCWPHQHLAYWLLPAAAFIAGFLFDTIRGAPDAAAAAFLVAGFANAAASAARGVKILPLSAAWWIGLASLFHVEYAAWWVALGLVWLVSPATSDESETFPAFIRLINGAILITILLVPVFWWNSLVVGVPLPRAPDASMSLTAIASEDILEPAAELGFLGGAKWMLGSVYAAFGLPGMLFGAVGLILAAAMPTQLRSAPLARFVWALLVLVFAAPLLQMVSGGAILAALAAGARLIWLVGIGVFIICFASWLRDRADPAAGLQPRTVYLMFLVLLGLMAWLSGMIGSVATPMRKARSEARILAEKRDALKSGLPPPAEIGGAIATDSPGFLLAEGYPNAIDLTGRLHPVILNWAPGGVVRDADGLRVYLQQRNTRFGALLSDAAVQRFAPVFDCPAGVSNGPVVCRFTPGEAF
ncbi:MAG: hypothetical protein NZ740_03850 [Kiritimatiellae bacterium]|nr:hypothetical protein [Kiritimatiellia bacterium]MDW8458223.1 hypothetical protein [Verrucomicrobiota bacterium]